MKRTIIAAAVAAAFAFAGQLHGRLRDEQPKIIQDKLLEFDPAGTLITVTAASTNVLDMQQQRDMAIGEEFLFWAVVTVSVALLAAGAGTLRIQVQGSVDNVTWTTLCQSDDIPKANLTVGQTIEIPIAPQAPHSVGIPRYYRLNYVVTTGPFTAGALNAALIVAGYQASNPPTYPPGVVVAN